MDVIRGKISDTVLKHGASRMVQAAVKYGGQKEKDKIAGELKGRYRELTQNQCAKVDFFLFTWKLDLFHFIVPRNPTNQSMSHPLNINPLEFQSHVLRSLLDRESSSILEDSSKLYINAYERFALLCGFYRKGYLRLLGRVGRRKRRTEQRRP